ncbi:hypothetical protein JW826_04095 [Candidatus Woesearchaeota archaeon]|nr:hypothetical protein [Candidatus Woesearchaeota archaeon]
MAVKKKAKKASKASKSRISKRKTKRVVRKKAPAQSIFTRAPPAPAKPVKPKKNYKLPNYKKKCIGCAQFKFIKGGWSLCMQCYEKRYGRYLGEDRFLYVK